MGQDNVSLETTYSSEQTSTSSPQVTTLLSSSYSDKDFMEKATSSSSICSSDSSSHVPFTIDLTGPMPVIGVLNRDGTEQKKPQFETISVRRYNRLIREASQVPVVVATSIPNGIEEDISSVQFKNVSDIDPELLKEGKEFIQRNFFAIILAHLVAIAFLLAIKPVQALLLRTGSIHKKENTLKRYLSLIIAIKNLYECDLVEADDVESAAKKSSKNNGQNQSSVSSIVETKPQHKYNEESVTGKELDSLRRGLSNVSKNYRVFVPPPTHTMRLDAEEQVLLLALKEDLALLQPLDKIGLDRDKIYTTINPDVPLSQYDMVMLQFAFFGFITLFPTTFGIHESTKKFPKNISGFIHLWGVLGKRFGIEDKFNLCLNRNFDSETNLEIFREIFLFSFKLADDNLLKLWRTMTAGSSRYFFFFRTKSMLQFMLKNVAKVQDCHNVYFLMNFFEKLCYHSHQFCVSWLLRFWVTRVFVNLCARTVFFLGYKLYLRRIKLQKEKYEYDRDMIVKTVH